MRQEGKFVLLSLGHTEGHRFTSVSVLSLGKTNRDKETTETAEDHTKIQKHVHGKLSLQLINIMQYWKKICRDRKHLEIDIKCPSQSSISFR